jgi:hypothetical protein
MELTMVFRAHLLMSLLSLFACGSDSNRSTTPAKDPAPEQSDQIEKIEQQEPAGKPVHLRALFYMERIQADGSVKGWPTKPESPTVGPGEQAWLEVHTSGAAHAYAFALFTNGLVSPLWQEDMKKIEHTPPMNAFGEGLGLSQDFETGAKLLVIASKAPLAGLEQAGDCAQASTVCTQLKNWSEEAGKHASNQVVQMKQGELRVPAFGRMGEGPDIAVIRFDFMDAGR